MFEIGKIPPQILERNRFRPGDNTAKSIGKIFVVRPKTGEDCSAMDPKEELCVFSTDPISGATQKTLVIWQYISTVTMYFPQVQSLWGF